MSFSFFKMNKRGIELSVNFLVVIIVAIVMFIMGITLFYTVFNKANDYEKQISDQMRRRIESLLSQGKIIAIPDTQKEIERGDTNSFAIGVSNELKINSEFFLEVRNDSFIDENDVEGHFFLDGWNLQYNEFGLIQKDNYKANLILISVPKNVAKGTYIFNVYVCNNTVNTNNCQQIPPVNLYTGAFNKIYVVVP